MADRALTVTFIGNDAQLNAAFKRVSTQLNGLQRAGSGLQSLGSSLTRNVTLPLVAIGAASAKMATDFQASTERLRTQAGATQAQVEKLRGGILDMAKSVAQSPDQLSAGMYHVVSSMNALLPPTQRAGDELKVLKTAAQLATVSGSDLEETSYALASAMNALHAPISQTSKIAGQMNAIVGAGDETFNDLLESLKSGLLPTAKQVGLSFQSVGAALAVMGDMGQRGALAGTRLRMSIALLASPAKQAASILDTLGLSAQQATSTSHAMSDALAAAGLRTTNLAADLKKPDGFMAALQDLNDHLRSSGLTATGAAAVMAKAFGGGKMGQTITLLAQNTDRLRLKFDQIGTDATGFGAAWDATTQTAAFKWHSMLASIQADAIKIGQAVLPVVLQVADKISGVVDTISHDFTSLPQGLQATIIKGGLVLATVGPALKILGLFTSGLGRLYSLVNGRTFTSIVGGGTAAAPAARATSAAASSTGVVSAVSSGLRTGVSRGLQGLSIAGLGVAVSQTVGSSIHGAVGAAVKSIGTDASIGAGMGAVFGPEGIAGGAMIGGLIGAFRQFVGDDAAKEGQEFADKFTAPLGPAVAKKFNSSIAAAQTKITTTQQTQQVRKNIAASPGLARGGPGGAGLPTPSNAALEKQFHDQGVRLGEATVAGLKSVKDPSSNIILSDFLLQLKKLPSQAQPSAAKTMLDFAIGLEQSGKLPYNSLQTIIKGLEGQIPGFSSYLNNEGQVINQVFSKTLMLSPATATLKSTLAGYRQQFGDWSISTKVTASNIDQTISTAMTHLHDTVASSSGQTRKDALSELGKLHDQTIAMFNNMGDKVQTSIKNMSTAIKDGSASAAKVASTNLGSFAANVQQAMSNSVLSTGQGMKLIIDNTNKALKEMGQKQLSPIQVGALTLGIGKQQQLVGHAGGGMVQFGRHGDKGRDTIPVNFGGAHIAVGSGEVGMVANHDQQAFLNARTADVGGLSGVFSKFNRPHYMAGGGFVVGASEFGGPGDPTTPGNSGAYGTDVTGSVARLQSGGPYFNQFAPNSRWTLTADTGKSILATVTDLGGGGGSVGGHPRALDLWWQTANALGLPGSAGNWTGLLNVTPAGVAGSAPGGLAAAVSKIVAPAVNGSGAIANVVKGALGKTAAAANAFLAKLTPTVSGGAGGFSAAGLPAAGGGFDPSQLGSYNGVPVAKWIIPELNWARGHGWVGSVTSGWRSPTAVVHGEFATAPQGQSEHQYDIYPGGAVDVSDYQQFAQIIQGYPGADKLIQLGIDPLHFSGTGHARGGMVGFAKGGMLDTPTTIKQKRTKALGIMKQLWGSAHSHYPGAGASLPRTVMAPSSQPFVGDVYSPNHPAVSAREVLWPDWMTDMLLGKAGPAGSGGIGSRNAALETLVHEWAHQYQSPSLISTGKMWEVEGGAQAFTRAFAPGIVSGAGFKNFGLEATKYDTYYQYVEKVRKRFGDNWIKSGQFSNMKEKYASGGMLDAFAGGGMPRIHGAPSKKNWNDYLATMHYYFGALGKKGFLPPGAGFPRFNMVKSTAWGPQRTDTTGSHLIQIPWWTVMNQYPSSVSAPYANFEGAYEMGHAFQKDSVLRGGLRIAEGGDTAWADAAFPSVGLMKPPSEFEPYADWVRKTKGANWVMRGQFGAGDNQKKAHGGMIGPLPFAGSFDKGGTIPGRVGQPMLGVVHGGEHVIPAAGGFLSTGSGLSAKIQQRDAEASLVKQQLNANLKQLASLEQALTDVSKQPALRNEITNLRAEEDTTKGTAKRAELRKQITQLEGRLQTVEGQQRSKLEKQINAIKAQNEKLGGDETKVGTGGLLSTLSQPVSVGIPSQSIGSQIKLAQLSNAVSTAQNSGNTNAQKTALQKEMKYEKSWLSADKKQLKKVNSLLSKRGLSRKQRGQLLQDKLALIQEIGTIEGDIGGISSSLSDLATSTTPDSTDSSGTDTSGDSGSGDSDVVDALNALTDAIQAQTQAEAALQATLQAQNAYMSSAGAIETKQAIKAFSDVISGQIGGRYLSRATGSAGDGSVARY